MSDQYETRGFRRFLLELGGFFKNSLGNFFSLEFLTIFIPLLLLWKFLPRWNIIPESLIPSLSTVAKRFWFMLWHKQLVFHILYSMGRFFIAFGIAVVLAIPIGLLMGWNLKIRAYVLPLWQLLSPIPPPAFVPMTIIFFGIGSKMHVFLMFKSITKFFSVINEKGLAEGLTAVLNVSLTIPDGKIVSLLGPSGCGKSTFLEILAGLQAPTDGTIHIDGKLVLEPLPSTRKEMDEYKRRYRFISPLANGVFRDRVQVSVAAVRWNAAAAGPGPGAGGGAQDHFDGRALCRGGRPDP